MDELFRFVALRPPMPVSDEIVLDGASPLALRLAKAREAPDGRHAIDELAQSYVRSDDFVQDASSLNLPLDKLAEALDHARFDWSHPSDPSLDDLVKRTLGEPSRILVKSPKFIADLTRLQDSLLAIKLSRAGDASAASVLGLLSTANVVQRIASGQAYVTRSKRRFVRLPASIFPLPSPAASSSPDEPHVPSDQPIQEELLARAGAIDDALAALTAFTNRPGDSTQGTADGQMIRRGGPAETATPPTDEPVSSPPNSLPSSFVLDATDIARLTPSVRAVLAEYRIDPVTTTLPSMLRTLRIELGRIEEMLK